MPRATAHPAALVTAAILAGALTVGALASPAWAQTGEGTSTTVPSGLVTPTTAEKGTYGGGTAGLVVFLVVSAIILVTVVVLYLRYRDKGTNAALRKGT